MAVYDMFEGLEGRVIRWLAGLFGTGIILLSVHELYKSGILGFLPATSKDGFLLFVAANLLDDFGASLIVAGVIGVFFELVLRKGTLIDISVIVDRLRKPPFLREFRLARHELDQRLSADIRSLRPGERIDLLGISLRVVFSEQPGIEAIREKVVQGCEFRVLVLHPYSALVPCIQNFSKHFGYPDLRASLRETFEGRVKALVERLGREENRKGRLEIRMHKDLFSTLSYHSSPRLKVLGLYFAHKSGTLCPVLELEAGRLSEQAEAHFETIWQASESNVLILVDPDKCEEQISRSFK